MDLSCILHSPFAHVCVFLTVAQREMLEFNNREQDFQDCDSEGKKNAAIHHVILCFQCSRRTALPTSDLTSFNKTP